MLYKALTTTLAAALLGASGTLAAAPINVVDNYVGADADSTFYSGVNYGDVVGDNNSFDISSMDVSQNGSIFDFTVNTAFAGKAGTLFHSLTQGGTGIGYGDLFLANNWTPEGTAPYVNDDAANGTDWTWGLRLSDRYNDNGGDISLFRLQGSNPETSIISDELMTGGDWRRGQEVLIDDGTNAANSGHVSFIGSVGSWTSSTGQLNINANLSQTDLLNGNTLAFHWGMTCANDVIEGQVDITKVPEPGTIGLVALALVGIFFMRRRPTKA